MLQHHTQLQETEVDGKLITNHTVFIKTTNSEKAAFLKLSWGVLIFKSLKLMLFCFFIQGVFWRSQLYIDQPQFLKFNISVQRDALVGVYGRKGLPPSHTQVTRECKCYQNYFRTTAPTYWRVEKMHEVIFSPVLMK